ncbi:hypothetical protein Asulf_01826 [Archaeoglobus sulfaticallidus PM70-1]|uniref:Fe-S-cluster oxidoreductase n=1 Tax=Archaeoglobus sulfaticallidus PM70-1 TaxID=387631 RepID=N0BHK6_9EURY|nr:YkgJ family cysteine cluster protein [Archaeoglobus sulfaticallidus]AGK61797.1 hypothetical protein Asulf_01826 [Archaeoglobus sulfaticallidus PM70-1]
MKVPWRRVSSWHCSACGKCCREYRVPLTFGEYLRFKKLGLVEEKRKFYLRKINGKCPFQIGNICSIQDKKPIVCKLFPFTIRFRGNDDALYWYGDEEYYVYIDVSCKNIVFGSPTKSLKERINEAIELFNGLRTRVHLLQCLNC